MIEERFTSRLQCEPPLDVFPLPLEVRPYLKPDRSELADVRATQYFGRRDHPLKSNCRQ